MRREAVQLVRQAVREGRRAYVLVNDRSEGTAPLTVQGLAELLRGSGDAVGVGQSISGVLEKGGAM